MRSVVHIEAPVEEVFSYFIEPDKSADLMVVPGIEVREYKRTEEGTGTYTAYRGKIAGIPVDSFSVITDYEPNRHITETSSNPLIGTWDYRFEPEGTGTKLVMEHHSRSFWGIAPVEYLVDMATTRINETFMERLKDRIETTTET